MCVCSCETVKRLGAGARRCMHEKKNLRSKGTTAIPIRQQSGGKPKKITKLMADAAMNGDEDGAIFNQRKGRDQTSHWV